MKARIESLGCLMLLLIGVSLTVLSPQSANAQGRSRDRDRDRDRGAREVYTGTIYYFGGPRGSVSTTFTLNIDSLSPDSEVQRFVETLQRDGQDGLLRVLGKEKRGTLQVGSSIGRDINAVWVTEEEEGRKITILSERWLGFGELRRGARSVDYPFAYIELFVDDQGKGEGTMIPAGRVRYKKGKTIEIENFGIYPARLMGVRRRGR